jgi:glycine reductase
MEPVSIEGPTGPGKPLQEALEGKGEIVVTVACGDDFFSENPEGAIETLLGLIERAEPDLFIAGPAFNAGRYGYACGEVCSSVAQRLNIPVVTGMAEENPGLAHRKDAYIVRTVDTVGGMKAALQTMAALSLKLMSDGPLGLPRDEGYFPRGFRRNARVEKTGAERALAMLLAKIGGEPFETELALPTFDRVPPAPPVPDLSRAAVALITTGGLVPTGNPDRLESTKATRYGKYSIQGADALDASAYEGHHGGYSTMYINEDPNRLLPLDALRALEQEGSIGKVSDHFYAFSGCSTYYESAVRMGREIAGEIKSLEMDAALITSA